MEATQGRTGGLTIPLPAGLVQHQHSWVFNLFIAIHWARLAVGHGIAHQEGKRAWLSNTEGMSCDGGGVSNGTYTILPAHAESRNRRGGSRLVGRSGLRRAGVRWPLRKFPCSSRTRWLRLVRQPRDDASARAHGWRKTLPPPPDGA
jgi:hypothetical protein